MTTFVSHIDGQLFTPKYDEQSAEELISTQRARQPGGSNLPLEEMAYTGKLVVGAQIDINSASGVDGRGPRPTLRSCTNTLEYDTNFIIASQQFELQIGTKTTLGVSMSNGDGVMLAWGVNVKHRNSPVDTNLMSKVKEKNQAQALHHQVLKQGGSAGMSTVQADGQENIDLKGLTLRGGEKVTITVMHKFALKPGESATFVHRGGYNPDGVNPVLAINPGKDKFKNNREMLPVDHETSQRNLVAILHNDKIDQNNMGLLHIVDGKSFKPDPNDGKRKAYLPSSGGNFCMSLSGGPPLAESISKVETYSIVNRDSTGGTLKKKIKSDPSLQIARIVIPGWESEGKTSERIPIILPVFDTSYSMGTPGMKAAGHFQETLRLLSKIDPDGKKTGIKIDRILLGFSDSTVAHELSEEDELKTNGCTSYEPMIKQIRERYEQIRKEGDTSIVIANIFTDGLPQDKDQFYEIMKQTREDPMYAGLMIRWVGLGPYLNKDNVIEYSQLLGPLRGDASKLDHLEQDIPGYMSDKDIENMQGTANEITDDMMQHQFLRHNLDLAELWGEANPMLKFNQGTTLLTVDGVEATHTNGIFPWKNKESAYYVAYRNGKLPQIESVKGISATGKNQKILNQTNKSILFSHLSKTLPKVNIFNMDPEAANAIDIVGQFKDGIKHLDENEQIKITQNIASIGIHMPGRTSLIATDIAQIAQLHDDTKKAHADVLANQSNTTRESIDINDRPRPKRKRRTFDHDFGLGGSHSSQESHWRRSFPLQTDDRTSSTGYTSGRSLPPAPNDKTPQGAQYRCMPESFFVQDDGCNVAQAANYRSLRAMQPQFYGDFSSSTDTQNQGGPQEPIWRSMGAFSDMPASAFAGASASSTFVSQQRTVVAHAMTPLYSPINKTPIPVSRTEETNHKIHSFSPFTTHRSDTVIRTRYTLEFFKSMLFEITLSSEKTTPQERNKMLKEIGYDELDEEVVGPQCTDSVAEFESGFIKDQSERAKLAEVQIKTLFEIYRVGIPENILKLILEKLEAFNRAFQAKIEGQDLNKVMSPSDFKESIVNIVADLAKSAAAEATASAKATEAACDEIIAQAKSSARDKCTFPQAFLPPKADVTPMRVGSSNAATDRHETQREDPMVVVPSAAINRGEPLPAAAPMVVDRNATTEPPLASKVGSVPIAEPIMDEDLFISETGSATDGLDTIGFIGNANRAPAPAAIRGGASGFFPSQEQIKSFVQTLERQQQQQIDEIMETVWRHHNHTMMDI